MEIVTDDGPLFEILIRLPDSRSIIQCATVCKHWYSLVSRSEYFIRSFNHHHRQKRLLMGPNSRYYFPFTPPGTKRRTSIIVGWWLI
ncbi:F-box domain containing protein [Parasponia andersonii]|uniref:F-box domain containing protein n=1 Tax=Parasponia andersonii TaxID=3476 RepID=A0A2P5CQ87_PARAD|nr:F-box domain containing protein [Parasponia andersonii]